MLTGCGIEGAYVRPIFFRARTEAPHQAPYFLLRDIHQKKLRES